MNYVVMEKAEIPAIVKKQRSRGIGKLGMQKTVKEDDFEVEPAEATKLHGDLEQEHLDKMKKFDDVIGDFQKEMKKHPKDSKEYKRLHAICSVNKVEKERHRQHAESHHQCKEKHEKLAKLYEKGIPGDKEVDSIVGEGTI
jgi:hypothetical protein